MLKNPIYDVMLKIHIKCNAQNLSAIYARGHLYAYMERIKYALPEKWKPLFSFPDFETENSNSIMHKKGVIQKDLPPWQTHRPVFILK